MMEKELESTYRHLERKSAEVHAIYEFLLHFHNHTCPCCTSV